MKTIYIDSNYICHATDDGTRTEVETELLDNVCEIALECYKFIPAHDGHADFVQCFDSKVEEKISRQNRIDEDNSLDIQADLMNEIEDLCNELIGE